MKQKLKIRAKYCMDNDITLRVGDCRKLLREIPDEAAQLVVTSPPYNIGKPYECKRTLEEYIAEQKEVITECSRVVKEGGSICWQVGQQIAHHGHILPLDIILHPIFAEQKLILRNRIVWHFEHGLHCERRFSGRYEVILWYSKGDKYTFNLDAVRMPQKYPGKKAYKGPRKGEYSGNPKGKNPGDVWIFPNVKCNHIEKTIHPCQFPIELPERLILALTNSGDLVVDPFVGVGSTLLAAAFHGRKAAGTDTVNEYVTCARKRLCEFQQDKLRRRQIYTPVYVPLPNSPLVTRPLQWPA